MRRRQTTTSLQVHGDDELVETQTQRMSLVLSPLTSPRRDLQEDPFSLTGFFPSRPGSPSAERLWLSPVGEHDRLPEIAEDARAQVESAVAQRSLSMNALDDYAKKVIAKEDRLGILSLGKWLFSMLCLSAS